MKMNVSAMKRHDIDIERQFDDVPEVEIEKQKVLQILINLMSNAKQALVAREDAERRLIVRIGRAGEMIRIEVTDNGVGIRPENLTRIFSHGFTTRREGHGFGLHHSAIATREMGGTLTAHSDGPGTGATFVLTLPCRVAGRKSAA